MAAIVLGLIALMGLFGSLISVVVSLVMQNPATVPAVPGMRAFMVLITLLFTGFWLFCLWTVVGLFRMRPWARYSILVIGGLEFCFSLLMCAVMILVRSVGPSVPPPVAPSPISYQILFLGIGVFYGLLSFIGLWWLVYFNLRPVRAAFSAASPSAEPAALPASPEMRSALPGRAPVPAWRVVIIVWACLMLLGVLFFPMMLFLHLPIFLFGIVFRGAAAAGLLLMLVVVQLYLGVGLLKKWKPAWYVGWLWQLYTVAVFLTFLAPGVYSRFAAYQRELMMRWGLTIATGNGGTVVVDPEFFMKPGMVLGLIAGFAMVILFTIALLRRKGDYLRGDIVLHG